MDATGMLRAGGRPHATNRARTAGRAIKGDMTQTRRILVLGATGTLGRRVVGILRAGGHDVVEASRSSGVDVETGTGLADAMAGADTVIDCLNIVTLSRRRAVDFFTATTGHVVREARAAGVGHVVCLSIIGVDDPTVARAYGYYAGKAAQEQAYATSGLPTTVARTTQWFELTRTFLHQFRVGSVAFVAHMLSQPVAADAAARFVAGFATGGPAPDGSAELAGPERHDLATLARRVASAEEPGTRVVALPVPIKAISAGGLLPGPNATIDPTTFTEWLAAANP